MTIKGGVRPSDSKVQKTIVVEGREIAVKRPTGGQLLAWEAIISGIQKMDMETVDFPQMRAHNDRFYRLVAGLFVEEADKEWLIDAELDGVVSIEKESTQDIMNAVIAAYAEGEEDNRAQRRAAKRKSV